MIISERMTTKETNEEKITLQHLPPKRQLWKGSITIKLTQWKIRFIEENHALPIFKSHFYWFVVVFCLHFRPIQFFLPVFVDLFINITHFQQNFPSAWRRFKEEKILNNLSDAVLIYAAIIKPHRELHFTQVAYYFMQIRLRCIIF